MHKHYESNSSSTRIGWAFFLNVGFTIIEGVVYSWKFAEICHINNPA